MFSSEKKREKHRYSQKELNSFSHTCIQYVSQNNLFFYKLLYCMYGYCTEPCKNIKNILRKNLIIWSKTPLSPN